MIESDDAIYHTVKQIIIASLHGHPLPLVIEAARAERAELQGSIEDLRRAIEGLGSVSSNGQTAASPATAVSSDLVVAGSASYHRPDCRLVAGREQQNLVTIDDADHSFHVPARTGRTDAQVLNEALDRCATWVDSVTGR